MKTRTTLAIAMTAMMLMSGSALAESHELTARQIDQISHSMVRQGERHQYPDTSALLKRNHDQNGVSGTKVAMYQPGWVQRACPVRCR